MVNGSDPGEVPEAIVSVYHKDAYINTRTLKTIQNNIEKKPQTITISTAGQFIKREEGILQLISQQMTAKQIAKNFY